MNIRPDTDDYLELFVNDIPLMDVRAPIEFDRGGEPFRIQQIFPCSTIVNANK